MSSQDASDIDQASLLSDASLTALQLNQQPFGPIAPDAVSFSDETSAEQLADVKQALITGDDLLLILGEHGAGKSVLLNQLGANSGLRIQCFAVKGSPRFSTLNLFAGMLEAFKRKPPEKLKEILDDLIPCLQTMVARNTLSAIVLDDAHQVSESELTQLLSGMLYVNSQDETLMRVALAAPPEFEDRIPDLLPEGADLPYSSLTIDGMSPQRAADYLGFRLNEAGYTGELPFTEREMGELVDQSGGFPTGLHQAAAAALNHQYGPLEHSLPMELLNDASESFLQTRTGKLILGVLATALIVGGLAMFMPDTSDDDRYAAADQADSASAAEDAPKLRLVDEPEVVPLTESTTAETEPEVPADTPTAGSGDAQSTVTSSADSGDSSSQNNPALDADTSVEAPSPDTTDDPSSQGADTNEISIDVSATSSADTNSEPAASNPVTLDEDSEDEGEGVAESSSAADTIADSETDATVTSADQEAAVADGTESESDDPIESAESDTAATAAQDTNEPEPATQVAEAIPADSGASIVDDTPDVDPALADILESPTWILVQDPALITVQMSASRDRPSIENFLKRNRESLPPPNSIYTFQRNGETWYALLHGLFPSFDAAKAAVEQMPNSALTNQPWIRNVGRIQAALKAQ